MNISIAGARAIAGLAATLLLGALAGAPAVAADGAGDAAAEAAALREEIQVLDQRLKVLERQLELQQETAKAAAATAPVVRAGEDRFSLASTDGKNVIRFRATLNVDHRNFNNSLAPNGNPLAPGSSGFVLRTARPYIEGTMGGFVDYKLVPDFAGGKAVIQDFYMNARFKPWFALEAGKFKSPVGLERLQGDTDTRFIERALPDRIIPNRDIGVQVSGDLFRGIVTYQAAYLNGAPDGGSSDSNTSPDADNNDEKDVAIRVFALPFRESQLFRLRGLGIGIGASFVNQDGQVDATGAATNSLLPAYRTNGQQTFFAYRGGTTPTIAWGQRVRISPQAYYYYGPLGLLGEYVSLRQDVRRVNGTVTRQGTLGHSAWQLAGGWFVTGEDAAYRTPAPKRPFVLGGPGWGSLELTARVAEFKLDPESFTGGANSYANPIGSASKALAWTLGGSWGLTQNFKLILNYEQTDFTGGAAGNADAPSEQLLLSRFQLQF